MHTTGLPALLVISALNFVGARKAVGDLGGSLAVLESESVR